MKHFVIIQAFILFQLAAFAQDNFGLKLDLGISKVTDDFISDNSDTEFRFMPSGNAGIFYSKEIGENSMIGADLFIMHIRERTKITHAFTLPSNPLDTLGTINSDSKRYITSLSLPLYYGYKFNRFIPNIGIMPSLSLYEKHTYHQVIDNNGIVSESFNVDSQSGILGLSFGPRVGLFFNLTDHLHLATNYSITINTRNINSSMFRIYQHQLTIGARYVLSRIRN